MARVVDVENLSQINSQKAPVLVHSVPRAGEQGWRLPTWVTGGRGRVPALLKDKLWGILQKQFYFNRQILSSLENNP